MGYKQSSATLFMAVEIRADVPGYTAFPSLKVMSAAELDNQEDTKDTTRDRARRCTC